MAWVKVGQASKLTGKSRSALYRDMGKGRVSYRSAADGGRELDTSELIRVYGELQQGETIGRDKLGLPDETEKIVSAALLAEIQLLREEMAGLRQEMQEVRLLEHKQDAPEVVSETSRKWWELWKR